MKNIHKAYTDKVLFKGADFSVNTGDKIGVIGINGTGKSSLLKMIAGIDTCDAGLIVKAIMLLSIIFHRVRLSMMMKQSTNMLSRQTAQKKISGALKEMHGHFWISLDSLIPASRFPVCPAVRRKR